MVSARYFWLWMIAGVFINAWVFWRRALPHIFANPELEAGYRRLIRGYAFWMSLPWLVMGIGCAVGGVPTFHFMFPATGGPFVWAFWVVGCVEFLLLGYWAIWGGGAEALVRHPGIPDFFPTRSVRRMRWLLAGLAVFAVVWNTGFMLWIV